MKKFLDKDFLLQTETAKHLFHDYAKDLPLIDYHCHISPKEIYEDRRFNDLAEVWLGGKNPDGSYFGDHYKWRLMRSNGVPEAYVTGDKPGLERLKKFAEALSLAIGNPMYHWCHLELKTYFGYDGYLTPETAEEVWNLTKDKLQNDPEMTTRGLIRQSNVAFIGTTDDPIDSLEWHQKIKDDPTIEFKVCPSFRPDNALNIQKPGFPEYMKKLAASVNKDGFETIDDVTAALEERLDHFKKLDCRASDHGLDYIPFRKAESKDELNRILQKGLKGEPLSVDEYEKYQTHLLIFLGKAYHARDIVMQLHYSALRNANERCFRIMGPDTGFDMIAQNTCGGAIAKLLSELDLTDELPKTILYSLNSADFDQLGSLIGCFQSDEIPGKIQHGSGWWFNDTKSGMEHQLTSLANLGILGNFVGMLTDSRSFLSYTRHEYFRRVFCNLVGNWVENGEYPNDDALLKRIVEGVAYKNAKRYFGL